LLAAGHRLSGVRGKVEALMQLDKLQLDLRPRPNAQALDLGFMLLHAHAVQVYLAWLVLWLPLALLCGGLACLFPDYAGAWWLLAWWLKPLLERAPLYILSRQVFGETVSWRDALRAWPGQLGGGWFRMLTWWRPFMAGHGLYQPIWQLEGARGAVAAERRKVIGNDDTARSAFWFGVACVHFEAILQLGFLAFLGIFLSDEHGMSPLAFLFSGDDVETSTLVLAATFGCYALGSGIIGPIYTACCFTLYLNRRATLEAWDIEIMLRQIKPPLKRPRAAVSVVSVWPIFSLLAPALLALALWQPATVDAATVVKSAPSQDDGKCKVPEWLKRKLPERKPDASAEQAKIRKQLAQIYQSDDLRPYVCEESWRYKKSSAEKPVDRSRGNLPNLAWLAAVIKVLLIAAAICTVAWLLYRYRDFFSDFVRREHPQAATEIGGLDIRPESLPDDVAAGVRQLWEKGERRAALALLYRATLSRLVNEDGLLLTRGATEEDCLRVANQACRRQLLDAVRLAVVANATGLWLGGAYGDRWPTSEAMMAGCAAWHVQFGAPRKTGAGQP
jgi:hypothetical protein